MKEKKNVWGLSAKMIAGILLLSVILCSIICYIGYTQFTAVLEEQYNDAAYEVAETAKTYLNADRLSAYLESGEKDEEYLDIEKRLDALTESTNCNFIYVTRLSEDYMSSTYIFSTVHSSFLPMGYQRYPLGYTAKDMDPKYENEIKQLMTTGERVKIYAYSDNASSGSHTTAGVAVHNSDGKIIAFLGVEKAMTELDNARMAYVRTVVIATLIAVAAFLVIYIAFLRRTLVNPVLAITEEAQRFALTNEAMPDELHKIKNKDEIGKLASSLGKMEVDIINYTDNLAKITAEKERIGAELDVATRIQASMLPCIFPAFPDREEFEVYASMTPAKEVGGDFYDFFMVDEDNLAIVVADVSGKGVPAALFMVIGKTLIKDHTTPGRDLGEVFTEVNRLLCEANSEELFITAFVGVLNLRSGEFRYVNAGHELPFISRANAPFTPHKIRAAFVLAGMEGMKYKAGVFQLEPGDKIFQYTDGVTEATDTHNELFGMERLQESLERVCDRTPFEVLNAVKNDIDVFVGEAPQFDDITMLCLEYKKRAGSNEGKTVTDITLEAVRELTEYAESTFEEGGAPMAVITKMNIALDEIYSNIVKFSGATKAKVTCGVESGSCAYMILSDNGEPYNPLEQEDPDITLSAEERSIGGLGIYMVKKSMTNITYEYAGGINTLTLKLDFNK